MVHEIKYERDIHKSYMRIPAIVNECLDEKIIVGRNIEGTCPCEKCYVDGSAEYWYDITGKQDLEEFCNINEVEKELFEKIILGICNCLEVLEWNLVDPNCLMLQAELVFLDVRKQEVIFVLYPDNKEDIGEKLQGFMEFLLTKINHENMELVSCAYRVYEHILQGGYAISDIKQMVLESKMEMAVSIEPEVKEDEEILSRGVELEINVDGVDGIVKQAAIYLRKIIQTGKEAFSKIIGQDYARYPEVVYPETLEPQKVESTQHPTVCLASWKETAQGELLYEGKEGFDDFEIGHLICVVGKSQRVHLQIQKDTISQFHAKIEWRDDVYYIEDMNSTNGTYVNDELLNYKEKRVLIPGDIVRFADVKYRFI